MRDAACPLSTRGRGGGGAARAEPRRPERGGGSGGRAGPLPRRGRSRRGVAPARVFATSKRRLIFSQTQPATRPRGSAALRADAPRGRDLSWLGRAWEGAPRRTLDAGPSRHPEAGPSRHTAPLRGTPRHPEAGPMPLPSSPPEGSNPPPPSCVACPHPTPLSTNRTRTPPLLSTNRTRTPPLLSTSRTQTSREHHCLQLPTVAPIHVPTVPSREHHCLQLPRSRVEVLFAQAAACPISTG